MAGCTLAQNAYQAGPLAASLPITDTFEPAVAVAIAIAAFGEQITVSPLGLAAEVIGVAAIVAGIFTLDRSPLILLLQGAQDHAPDVDAGTGQA